MTPQDEHDPNNPAHALYCNPCYNRMPGIGIRPHMEQRPEVVEQDFTGSISGFDFPPDTTPVFDVCTENEWIRANQRARKRIQPRSFREQYLSQNGREDEAFEGDE